MPCRCMRGRKITGRIVHVIRVLACVTVTVQGSARRSAFLVAMRPSYSHSHGLSHGETWLVASLEAAPGTEGEPTWTTGVTS